HKEYLKRQSSETITFITLIHSLMRDLNQILHPMMTASSYPDLPLVAQLLGSLRMEVLKQVTSWTRWSFKMPLQILPFS
ncbi:MAG: hypothetical protein AAF789_02600, partial [Bacteroidota bacterium]